MKQTLKKLSGLLLALCMVLSLLPVTALAAPPPLPTSGIDWSLSENNVLTITSDTGMDNWLISASGKFTYSDFVKSVDVGGTTTAINASAFPSSSSITSVTIGSSVTSIGASAFTGCTNLKSVFFTGNTPPSTVASDAFDTAYVTGMYVPAAALTAYKTALSGYASLIYATPAAITKNSTTTYYPTLSDALEVAADGDTITLLTNITESASNAKATAGITVTIDGHGEYGVTAPVSDTESIALTLIGTGTVILKDLTLEGGTATSVSTGLQTGGTLDIRSFGTVTVMGGAANNSYGLDNSSAGTVDVTAASAAGTTMGVGVANNGPGTVNVGTAEGLGSTGIGVVNAGAGTINVTTATGGMCGVNNQKTGIVNVTAATGHQYGVYNANYGGGSGTVNVSEVTSTGVAVQNDNGGMVNAGAITGTVTGTSNTNVAAVTLHAGTGASCVLSSITIANSGSTIGTLPDVYKGGACSAQWYTDSALTNLFTMQEISPEATLYSSFYTVPVTPPPSGGGGSTAPSTTITTQGNTTTASTTAPATSDGNGGVSAAVTGSQLTDALTKALTGAAAQGSGSGAVVEIKVAGASTSTSVTASIPQSAFSELSDSSADGLMITTPIASIIFDGSALDAINGKAAGDINITAALANTSSLTDAEKAAVGDRPVYSFSVTSNGQTLSTFGGGSATVSLPYTLKSGEDPNAVVVYYVDASGTLQAMQGAYDAATGTVVFVTSHFSEYMIGYNKVAFTDVIDTAWYYDAVTFLAARGVTSGTTTANFSPDLTLTRGQFMTMLLRAYGISADTKPTDNFADAGDTYYTGYLAAAKRLGISGGVGNNCFAPEQAITRQEMFTLLYNALKVLNQLPSVTSGKILTDFTDAPIIATWAKDAMTLLVETGTVTGSGGMLSPAGTTTRAEMAQVLYSLLGK